jgi:hypothetical protein
MAYKVVVQYLRSPRQEKMLGSKDISPLIFKPYQLKLIGLFCLWKEHCVGIKEITFFNRYAQYAA